MLKLFDKYGFLKKNTNFHKKSIQGNCLSSKFTDENGLYKVINSNE